MKQWNVRVELVPATRDASSAAVAAVVLRNLGHLEPDMTVDGRRLMIGFTVTDASRPGAATYVTSRMSAAIPIARMSNCHLRLVDVASVPT